MEDLSGRDFGAYRIVGPLGSGGMAAVYRAYQPAVDREVALKILPRHLAQDPEFVARFKQEAQVLARLQHPHILPVHDFGEADGFTFIVMPFIETGTLANRLTGAPLSFADIRPVITQVGDALDCAHAQGLVHRDVKPSNILIDSRGNCLLADFGIAKILEGADTLTATGGLVGTPKYMAPEQGLGQEVDRRSDIYSLGVILYEMATGRVPFDAETPVAVVVKHIHDPLPLPRQVNPALEEPLQQVIFQAMAKTPAERFATAGVMVDAVSALTLPDAVPAVAPPTPSHPITPDALDGPTEPMTAPEVEMKVSPPPDPEPKGRGWEIALGAAAVALLLVVIWLNSGDPDTPEALTNFEETAATIDANEIPPSTAPAEDPPLLPSQATVNETPSADAGTIEPSPAASSPASSPPPTAAPSPPPTAGTPEPTETDTSERLRPDPQISRERVRQAMDSLRPSGAARGRGGFVPNNRERDLRRGRPNDPFPSSGTGTFLDRRVGARWTAASEPGQGFDGLLWVDANAYCNNLALARRSDWRLPTRPELNSLLERLDPERYPWGLTLWSADRAAGDPNRLWVTNSPLFAPEWSNAVRDDSGRRLTHHAVCVSGP